MTIFICNPLLLVFGVFGSFCIAFEQQAWDHTLIYGGNETNFNAEAILSTSQKTFISGNNYLLVFNHVSQNITKIDVSASEQEIENCKVVAKADICMSSNSFTIIEAYNDTELLLCGKATTTSTKCYYVNISQFSQKYKTNTWLFFILLKP